MNWLESIQEIKRVQENNRLVIFVGSGVSANSGIPTWNGLIKKFATKINYISEKCLSCEKANSKCTKYHCKRRFQFTPNEFLRIPEYYYQKDNSLGHTKYFNYIQKTLHCDQVSNIVDDEIIRILPHHIITTNYDALLENSNNINAQFYEVVYQDKDLLSKASDRYIVKMHGDLCDPKTIVLKESDYINYEQEHILISTFIKSLLINHTFLFVGYSLNDANLNLIIGWINYFCNIHGIQERPKNFLLQYDIPSEFEEIRLKKYNVFIINLNLLPEVIKTNVELQPKLKNDKGQLLFAYLKCITNPKLLDNFIPLDESLRDKYKSLNEYTKISCHDLINVQSMGSIEFKSQYLIFRDFEWYDKISKLINNDNYIINTFQKAGIMGIKFFSTEKNLEIEITQLQNKENLFKLYLDNKYEELLAKLQEITSYSAKIYYFYILKFDSKEIDDLILKEEMELPKGQYITLLLHKMRSRLASLAFLKKHDFKTEELKMLFNTVPLYYSNSVGFLKNLFQSNNFNHNNMKQILEKQEEKYQYENNTIYFENCYEEIWLLKAYAYDYYYFFKNNFLPLDYFEGPKKYFSYYLQAVLCSHTSIEKKHFYNPFAIIDERRPYPLGEIEIDMLVKYTDSKLLQNWIGKYSIQNLEILFDINVVEKFISFCKSFIMFSHFDWANQLHCFIILICLIDLNENDKIKIFFAFVEMIESLATHSPTILQNIIKSIEYIVNNMEFKGATEVKSRLCKILLEPSIYLMLSERYGYKLLEILNTLAAFVPKDTIMQEEKQIELIEDESKKCHEIFKFRNIINIQKYKKYLLAHINILGYYEITMLTIEKILPYGQSSLDRMLEIINIEVKEKEDGPNKISGPDILSFSIESCLILKLFDFDVDLSQLKPFIEHSVFLQFMLDPNGFDYSKVDTSQPMWQNLIFSNKYKYFFIQNKKDILTEELENTFKQKLATENQKKIVYGILLDDDQLRKYGTR